MSTVWVIRTCKLTSIVFKNEFSSFLIELVTIFYLAEKLPGLLDFKEIVYEFTINKKISVSFLLINLKNGIDLSLIWNHRMLALRNC